MLLDIKILNVLETRKKLMHLYLAELSEHLILINMLLCFQHLINKNISKAIDFLFMRAENLK